MRIRVPIAVLLAAAAFPLTALEMVGEITYLEGRVEIVRDGETLDQSLVKEGLDIANFDLLKSGSDGQAELRITSTAAPAATITVSPRTQFSIEIGKLGSRQQTTIDLVAGSVAMKCAKLTGSQGMRVQTETAFMGVRGTSFAVTAPASGDILVTCDEGEVECTDEKGRTLLANAGEAIEKPSGKPLARLAVAAAALAQYRRDWLDRQTAALRSDPLARTKKLAALYKWRKRQFGSAFAALLKSRAEIDAWRTEDRGGRIGTVTDAQRKQAREIFLRLVRVLKVRHQLERLHVQLLELKEYCEEQNITGRISLFETSAHFFESLERDRMPLEKQLAMVRMVMRLSALHNEGRLPGGAFGEADRK
jgi:hypothetical protein